MMKKLSPKQGWKQPGVGRNRFSLMTKDPHTTLAVANAALGQGKLKSFALTGVDVPDTQAEEGSDATSEDDPVILPEPADS